MMLRTVATILLIGCFIDEHVAPRHVTESISGIQIIDGICLAQRTDRLVYRHKNSTHVIIAFDILKKGVVDVFIWEIIRHPDGNFISSAVKEERMLALDFRKQAVRKHVIGATGRRHQKTFRHRVKRKMAHCLKLAKTKKKHCKVSAIHHIFARLKIRKVSYGNKDGCENE